LNQQRYRIVWHKEKKKGFTSTQEVVVFGLDNAQHIVQHMVPKGQGWDVYPM
tara:strand:- start:3104 stop:3259 length:156 start_codon:yes stop_codon:yes gene_type:complete